MHMTTLGWSNSSGIGGSDLSGNPNHIAVARKLDNGGIGMARARQDGDDQAAGAGQAGRGFEDVLKRLAQSSDKVSPVSEGLSVEINVVEDSRAGAVRSRIALVIFTVRMTSLTCSQISSAASTCQASGFIFTRCDGRNTRGTDIIHSSFDFRFSRTVIWAILDLS